MQFPCFSKLPLSDHINNLSNIDFNHQVNHSFNKENAQTNYDLEKYQTLGISNQDSNQTLGLSQQSQEQQQIYYDNHHHDLQQGIDSELTQFKGEDTNWSTQQNNTSMNPNQNHSYYLKSSIPNTVFRDIQNETFLKTAAYQQQQIVSKIQNEFNCAFDREQVLKEAQKRGAEIALSKSKSPFQSARGNVASQQQLQKEKWNLNHPQKQNNCNYSPISQSGKYSSSLSSSSSMSSAQWANRDNQSNNTQELATIEQQIFQKNQMILTKKEELKRIQEQASANMSVCKANGVNEADLNNKWVNCQNQLEKLQVNKLKDTKELGQIQEISRKRAIKIQIMQGELEKATQSEQLFWELRDDKISDVTDQFQQKNAQMNQLFNKVSQQYQQFMENLQSAEEQYNQDLECKSCLKEDLNGRLIQRAELVGLKEELEEMTEQFENNYQEEAQFIKESRYLEEELKELTAGFDEASTQLETLRRQFQSGTEKQQELNNNLYIQEQQFMQRQSACAELIKKLEQKRMVLEANMNVCIEKGVQRVFEEYCCQQEQHFKEITSEQGDEKVRYLKMESEQEFQVLMKSQHTNRIQRMKEVTQQKQKLENTINDNILIVESDILPRLKSLVVELELTKTQLQTMRQDLKSYQQAKENVITDMELLKNFLAQKVSEIEENLSSQFGEIVADVESLEREINEENNLLKEDQEKIEEIKLRIFQAQNDEIHINESKIILEKLLTQIMNIQQQASKKELELAELSKILAKLQMKKLEMQSGQISSGQTSEQLLIHNNYNNKSGQKNAQSRKNSTNMHQVSYFNQFPQESGLNLSNLSRLNISTQKQVNHNDFQENDVFIQSNRSVSLLTENNNQIIVSHNNSKNYCEQSTFCSSFALPNDNCQNQEVLQQSSQEYHPLQKVGFSCENDISAEHNNLQNHSVNRKSSPSIVKQDKDIQKRRFFQNNKVCPNSARQASPPSQQYHNLDGYNQNSAARFMTLGSPQNSRSKSPLQTAKSLNPSSPVRLPKNTNNNNLQQYIQQNNNFFNSSSKLQSNKQSSKKKDNGDVYNSRRGSSQRTVSQQNYQVTSQIHCSNNSANRIITQGSPRSQQNQARKQDWK